MTERDDELVLVSTTITYYAHRRCDEAISDDRVGDACFQCRRFLEVT